MIASVMQNAGNIIFGNLPLLFAVGVAVGLAGGEGTAGLGRNYRIPSHECNNGDSTWYSQQRMLMV